MLRSWQARAMNDAVLLDIDGPIATITLNRPEKLNPQSEEWTEGLLVGRGAAGGRA